MRLVSLVSGGIDSPVATYLMLRRGLDVVVVHVSNEDPTDTSKIARLVERLSEVSGRRIKAYVVPFYAIQTEIRKNCGRRFQCVLCKRMMERVAEKIAQRENADAIVTGDSLGQVASQTLQNLLVETAAVDAPIIRPLIGFDKNEAITIARDIGTYELSIQDAGTCPFVPNKPKTSAKLEHVLEEEEGIDVNALAEKAVEDAVIL